MTAYGRAFGGLVLLVLAPASCRKPTTAARTAAEADASVIDAPARPERVASGADDAAADTRDAPPATPAMGPQPIPAPWRVENIGQQASTESAVYLMNTSATYFTLRTASLDVGGTEDSLQFVSLPVVGDGEIIGKVRNVDYTGPNAKAGLMVRASGDPKAQNVFLLVGGGGVGQVQARTTAGGPTTVDDSGKATIRTNTWLRLTRTGNTFTAYRGDRQTWTQVGRFQVQMPPEARWGLAANASNATLAGDFQFDGVRVNNFVSDPKLDEWRHEDVGLVGGAALFDGGAAGTLRATTFGNPWSGGQEFFTFVFREVVGDCSIKLRVRSIEDTDASARVAAMLRASSVTSVSRTHAYAAVSLTAAKGAEFAHRPQNNGTATIAAATADVAARPPFWLRLERVGNRVAGFASPDGKEGTWKELGSTELALGAAMSIGIAVNAHTNAKMGSALVDSIAVTGMAPAPADAGAPADVRPPDAADAGANTDARDAPADRTAIDTRPDTRPDTRMDTRRR